MSPAALVWLQRAIDALKPTVEDLSAEEFLICLESVAGMLPEIVVNVRRVIEESHSTSTDPPKRHLSAVP